MRYKVAAGSALQQLFTECELSVNNLPLKRRFYLLYQEAGETLSFSPSTGFEIIVRGVRTCLWQLSRLRERLSP